MASPIGSAAQGFMAGLTQMMDWHRQQAQFDQQMQLRKSELEQQQLQMEALNSYREHELALRDREDQRAQGELEVRQKGEERLQAQAKAGQQMDVAQLKEQGVRDLGGLLGDLHRQRVEARSYGLDTSELDRDIDSTRSRLDQLFGLPGAGKPPQPQDRPGGTPEGQVPTPMPSRLQDLMKEHGVEQTSPLVPQGTGEENLPPRMRGRSTKSPLEERAAQERAATEVIHSQVSREKDLESITGGDVVNLTRNPDVNDINLAFADPKHQVPVRITANEAGTAWQWNRFQEGKAPQKITPDDIEEDPLISRDAAAGLMIAKRQGTLRPEIAESFESDVLQPTMEAYNRQLAALGKPIGMWGTFMDRNEKELTRKNEAGETVPVLSELDLVMRPDVQKLMQIGDGLETAKMAYGAATGKDMGELDNPIQRADLGREAKRYTTILRLGPNVDPEAAHAGARYLLERYEQEPEALKDKDTLKGLAVQLTRKPTESRYGSPSGPSPMDTMEPKEIDRWKRIFDQAHVTVPGKISGMAEPEPTRGLPSGGGGGLGGIRGMATLAMLGMPGGGKPPAAVLGSIGPNTKDKDKAAQAAISDIRGMSKTDKATAAEQWKTKREAWRNFGVDPQTIGEMDRLLGVKSSEDESKGSVPGGTPKHDATTEALLREVRGTPAGKKLSDKEIIQLLYTMRSAGGG